MTNKVCEEKKVVIRKAKAEARKAEKKWYNLRNIEIDRILCDMGYKKDYYSLYKFKKSWWTYGSNGSKQFIVIIDTYDLVHKFEGKLNVTVEDGKSL